MRYAVERAVPVPMRDGISLATDIWRPDGDGPFPVVLVRTPYGRDAHVLQAHATSPSAFTLVEAGYAVAVQDCRGTGASEGRFHPMADEAADGADTIAWLVAQSWCDGAVGMYGASYLGFAQWAAGTARPPGLRAIAPAMTSPDLYRAPWYSPGGALSLHTAALWSAIVGIGATVRALPDEPERATEDLAALTTLLGTLTPAITADPVPGPPGLRHRMPWLDEWLAHPDHDAYWSAIAADPAAVPSLQIAGWFDPFVDAAAEAFVAAGRSESPDVRAARRLVIGPWDHTSTAGYYPGRLFGPGSDSTATDLTGEHRRFFDRWVRGLEPPDPPPAPVRVFVMGDDAWREFADWPPPEAVATAWHLASSGRAATDPHDGRLDVDPPGEPGEDGYPFDPADPVPALGGRSLLPAAAGGAGPADQREVEARTDVATFTSATLEHPVTVVGPVRLELAVAADTWDADVVARLVDVAPDGCARYLTDGILRTRREPGPPGEVVVELGVTGATFRPGHRIRLDVAGSSFPRWDLSGPGGRRRILHGPGHASRLILPVVPPIGST